MQVVPHVGELAFKETPCYNNLEVITVSGRLERVLKDLEALTPEELRVISQAVLRRLAIPLRDPREFFDDWDDPEVDKAYADAW